MARNEVRIIGGKWKGRKLSFPNFKTLRPTLGRVRETLFNWLRADIQGASCLDLFAGSGALGFEALSRGSCEVMFVDIDRTAVRALRNNATLLLGDEDDCVFTRVHRRSARQFLDQCASQIDARWDVIFLDPPFDSPSLEPTLAAIAKHGLLKEHGRVYVESHIKASLEHPGWLVAKTSHAGDSQFSLLAREF